MVETVTTFIPPPFLEGQTTEEIHARMMRRLPADMDKGEGGFPWDLTRPTADEKAEYAGYTLQNAIRAIFPEWCDPYLLDDHAKMRGMKRKPAGRARGEILLTGTAGTELSAGAVVSTAAMGALPGVSFTLDSAVVLGDGETRAAITAAQPGAVGNVVAGTISIMDVPVKGIKTISNHAATAGGIDEEEDEALRERIMEYDRVQGVSYVGSKADYQRWAMEVPGVGSAIPQGGEEGDNTVKLTITDSNGDPADEALRKAVYDHIMRPDDDDLRLAGINDLLIVSAPEVLVITVAADVLTDGTATMEEIAAELVGRLDQYYRDESTGSTIRYTEIGAALLDCAGVADYAALRVNGGTANITITAGSIPRTGTEDLSLTEVSTV